MTRVSLYSGRAVGVKRGNQDGRHAGGARLLRQRAHLLLLLRAPPDRVPAAAAAPAAVIVRGVVCGVVPAGGTCQRQPLDRGTCQ